LLHHLNKLPQKPKRVVILGASGFVGSSITRQCKINKIKTLEISSQEIDLRKNESINSLNSIILPNDYIVAVAAIAPVKSLSMLSENLLIINNIIRAVQNSKIDYFLNIGSDAVFSDEPIPISEKSIKAPETLHGIMHLTREIEFSKLPFPNSCLRPTLIYGKDDPHGGYGPNQFRRLLLSNENLFLFGKGEETRDHIYIDDIGKLSLNMILNKSVGSMNAATGNTYSFKKIADIMIKLYNHDRSIIYKPRIGPMPHNGNRPFDITTIYKAFPNFEFTELSQGLKTLF